MKFKLFILSTSLSLLSQVATAANPLAEPSVFDIHHVNYTPQKMSLVVAEKSIFQAVINNRIEDVSKFLSDENSDPFITDEYGHTILHYACLMQNENMIQTIVNETNNNSLKDEKPLLIEKKSTLPKACELCIPIIPCLFPRERAYSPLETLCFLNPEMASRVFGIELQDCLNIQSDVRTGVDESQWGVQIMYNKLYPHQNELGLNIRKNIMSSKIVGELWSNETAEKVKKPASKLTIFKDMIKKYNIRTDDIDFRPWNTFEEWFEKEVKCKEDFFSRLPNLEKYPFSQEINTVCSPANAAVQVLHNLGPESKLSVKGHTFSLEKFLGNKKRAQLFEGGTGLIIRLAKYDIHHFYCPYEGTFVEQEMINGKYNTVQNRGWGCGTAENKREYNLFETQDEKNIGAVIVGAIDVAQINHDDELNQEMKRGDKWGSFGYGGSTIVLLFPKNTFKVKEGIVKRSEEGKEFAIQIGQPLGTFI